MALPREGQEEAQDVAAAVAQHQHRRPVTCPPQVGTHARQRAGREKERRETQGETEMEGGREGGREGRGGLTMELIFDLAEEGVRADAVLDSAVQQLPVPTDASGGKVALEKLHVTRSIQDVQFCFRRDMLCIYHCQEGNVRT